jgi:Zinc knuckle
VIEHYGGLIGDDRILIQEEKRRGGNTKGTDQEEAMFAESARNRAHAVAFLRHADQACYSLLVNDLENQFFRGNDQYPASVNDAYNLLINYKRPGGTNSQMRKATQTQGTAGNGTAGQQATAFTPTEVAFAQTSATNKNDGVQCYNCQAMGHYASECTVPKHNQENKNAGVQLLQHNMRTEDDATKVVEQNFCFSQHRIKNIIDLVWILLGSESTVSIFKNPTLLKNIRHCA